MKTKIGHFVPMAWILEFLVSTTAIPYMRLQPHLTMCNKVRFIK